jgi:hypothetical protein
LIFSRSHKPLWSSEVLTALAQFKRPIKLMIYLHAKNPRTANFVLNQAVYKKVFNRIVDERERLGLPCYPPLRSQLQDCTTMDANAETYRLSRCSTYVAERSEQAHLRTGGRSPVDDPAGRQGRSHKEMVQAKMCDMANASWR